jgi:hypothetical protein
MMAKELKIAPYVHSCIIQSGELEGNEYSRDVDPYEFELGYLCANCGEELVSGRSLLAHIYRELTDG